MPKEIDMFRNKHIIEIAGGEHHSIAILINAAGHSEVYSWGRNDDSQCG